MRRSLHIVFALVVAFVVEGSCNRLPRPLGTPNPPGPLSEGEGLPHEVCQELAEIDSLMWKQPDSALKVMMEFAGSEAADSLDVFEGHYCQVLVAELLYKNYYKQSNRKELVKAVHYFDSVVGMDGADARGKADARGVSVRERDAFLAARAHYINGVGLYERDSVVAACGEYLKVLEIVETHFPNLETQDFACLQVEHLPRFMGLTYGRLAELFSGQFMQEPAIFCFKKALAYDKIEPGSPLNQSSLLYFLGKQHDKLNRNDSAAYYYNEALRMLPDTNNMVYRDLVSQTALLNYEMGNDAESSIRDLKRMVAKATEDYERLTRYSTLGAIYCTEKQYDSALVYLNPVFENKKDPLRQRVVAAYLRDFYVNEGDTLKAGRYARFILDNTATEGESNAQVSALGNMFQKHLQWEKEWQLTRERQLAQQRRTRNLATVAAVLLALGLSLWWWTTRRKKEHEAETQTWHEEKQQLQTQVDDALQQLQTQADDALQQARAMLPQRANEIYGSKVGNRLERIMDEFEAAYPKALERVAAAYPDLTPTERRIFVLSHLQFRAKEMADLLGLSENTVNQYRYNLRKKTENTSFSAFLD